MVACYDRAQLRLSERLSEDGLLTALTVARVAGETAHQANVISGRCLVCERRRRARSGEGAGLALYCSDGARSGTDDGDGQGPPYKG